MFIKLLLRNEGLVLEKRPLSHLLRNLDGIFSWFAQGKLLRFFIYLIKLGRSLPGEPRKKDTTLMGYRMQ
jgi:hypothetical protein